MSTPVPGAELTFDDPGAPWTGAAKPSLREPGDGSATEPPGGHARFGTGPGASTDASESPDASANPAWAPSTTADRLRPAISPDELRRQAAMRKITVGSVAAVAVVLILTAAVLLTVHGAPHRAGSTTTTRPGASTSTSTSTTRVTATTVPVVKPISTSGDTATFTAPSGKYTLRFSTTSAACWVGIQPSLGSGTYLWSQTVPAGSSGAYRASGGLAVQLGAPAYLSVTVNGIPVRLPPGVTYYNLVFASG